MILLKQFCSQHKHELQWEKLLWACRKQLPATHTQKRVRHENMNTPHDSSLTGGLLGMHFYNCFLILTCFKNATETIFSSEGVLFLVAI